MLIAILRIKTELTFFFERDIQPGFENQCLRLQSQTGKITKKLNDKIYHLFFMRFQTFFSFSLLDLNNYMETISTFCVNVNKYKYKVHKNTTNATIFILNYILVIVIVISLFLLTLIGLLL